MLALGAGHIEGRPSWATAAGPPTTACPPWPREPHLRRLFTEDVGCRRTAYVAAVRLEAALSLRQAGETAAAAARRSSLGGEENLRRAMRRRTAESSKGSS